MAIAVRWSPSFSPAACRDLAGSTTVWSAATSLKKPRWNDFCARIRNSSTLEDRASEKLSLHPLGRDTLIWNIYKEAISWVNYNISPTWIKAIWEWFPLLTMIPVRSQWGRYNLPRIFYQSFRLILSRTAPAWHLDTSMAMQQEPIDWRYLPYIRPMVLGLFKGISPQNMAKNMVRLHTSILGSWRSPIEYYSPTSWTATDRDQWMNCYRIYREECHRFVHPW